MRRLEAWFWAVGIWLSDYATKRLILAHAEALRLESVEVLGDFFRIVYVRNPGAAMGLMPFGRWTLVSISAGAVVLLCLLLVKTETKMRARRLAMGLILGGALGNLVDRVFYGGLVVDFLDFGIGTHRFWAFNVADMGVSCGGVLLLILLLLEDRQCRQAEALCESPLPVSDLDDDDDDARPAEQAAGDHD